MEVQIVDRGRIPREDANGQAQPAVVAEYIDTQAGAEDADGEVHGKALLKRLEMLRGEKLADESINFPGTPGLLPWKLIRPCFR